MQEDFVVSEKNPRINVTFEKETAGLLTHLAQREHKSVARLVRELALESLEKREDKYLSEIAANLDKEGAEIYDQDDVWK